MQSSLFFCVTYFYYSRREVVSTTGACRVKVTQSSGIAMSGVRHVNKIPTIRGTDILRDARLNKVKRLKVVVIANDTFLRTRLTNLLSFFTRR